MYSNNNNNRQDPEDTRNLVIFFVLAAVLYFGYHALVLKPQQDALKLQQKMAAERALTQPIEKPVVKLREEALGTSGRVTLDNGVIFGSINLKGGRIDDIAFHNYYQTLEKKKSQVLLSPEQTDFPRYVEYGWVAKNTSLNVPDNKTLWQIGGDGNTELTASSPVTLVWDNGAGLVFERTYSVDEKYLFTVVQKVTNQADKNVTLYPYGLIVQQGLPNDFSGRRISHEGPTGFIGDELRNVTYKNLRKGKAESLKASQGWVGITDMYWLTSFIPPQGELIKYSFQYSGDVKDTDNVGKYQVDYVGSGVEISPGETVRSESHVFTGAKEVYTLKDYGDALDVRNFDLAVDFGMLWFLSKPFFFMLHMFGQVLGNMGFAIILLTVLIRSAAFPLTNKSYRSFAKMKKFSPEVTRIRREYSDDKQLLQKKIMEFYQKEGVNPMAGCIPILLQIPIFFALYKTLFVTIEIRHAPFIGWIHDLSAPDPTSIFNLFGLIPWTPPAPLMIGVWPCLMLVAMLIQKNLNPPPQDPLQRDMARFFPFMMAFILARFPAGLVVYWTCSAFIGALQQIIIMRSLDVPIYLFGQSKEEEELEHMIDEGPAIHPMTAMVKDEVEHALIDHDDEDTEGDSERVVVSPPKKKRKSSASKPKKKKK